MTPRATVLMPVYNAMPFLPQAVDAILSQTFADFTFLIIDDGSQDGSLPWLQTLGDSRLHLVVNQTNQGLIATLNHGLRLVQGEYVLRMDADDTCHPERLARQIAFMDAHPHLGASGSALKRFGGAQERVIHYPARHADIAAALLFHNAMPHAPAILRTAALRAHGLTYRPQYPHAEDWDLWRRAARCFPLANLPDVLYHYRDHGGAVTRRRNDERLNSVRRLFAENFYTLGLSTDGDSVNLLLRIVHGESFPNLHEGRAALALLHALRRAGTAWGLERDALGRVVADYAADVCQGSARELHLSWLVGYFTGQWAPAEAWRYLRTRVQNRGKP